MGCLTQLIARFAEQRIIKVIVNEIAVMYLEEIYVLWRLCVKASLVSYMIMIQYN